jgi:hypothetical protein
MAKKKNDIQNDDLKTNIIILRSAYGKTEQECFIQPMRNKYGVLPDCVRKVNSDGDMILSDTDKQRPLDEFIPENHTFVIKDGTTFDLNVPRQKAEWEAIENCFLIAKSRDAKDAEGNYLIDGTTNKSNNRQPRYGRAIFYIERPGLMAQKQVSHTKLVNKAQNFIFEDPRGYDGLLVIAKVLGRNMTNQPAADLEHFLLSYAAKYPQKVIELYTGGDLSLQLLFITAKEKGVIRKESGLYIYGESPTVTLGASDAAVIEWMKQSKNQATLKLIRQDTFPESYLNTE